MLDRKEKQEIMNLMEPGFVFLEEATGSGLNSGYCSAIRKRFIYISCYGDVQPCCYVPLSFGNIRSEPLIRITKRMWNHPIFNMNAQECIMNNSSFRKQYVSKMLNSELPMKVDWD
jgi:hypothetical protein